MVFRQRAERNGHSFARTQQPSCEFGRRAPSGPDADYRCGGSSVGFESASARMTLAAFSLIM
jgi:hypothetical protein